MKDQTEVVTEELETKDYPPVDTSKFKPITLKELVETLGLTIKKDETNKLITFLAQLSAYTENSQLNLSFNAPSSTGKSFIPTEIAKLFPEEDVIEVGYCSPTAFFHDIGKYIKEKKGYIVDLSRKILIFLDQPHTLLLQHLRPFLSHDKKEIRLKITDKSKRAGLKTKNIYLIGFPAVIFCTAGLKLDEQEATRFLLLSPEINQEKIRQAVLEKIKKESNSKSYLGSLDKNSLRRVLKERIVAIKEEQIQDVIIEDLKKVEKLFFKGIKSLKPRHQRDIGRIISLIKVFALFNLWFREKRGGCILANDADINNAFKIWTKIYESQELNLPPYIYHFYQEVILTAWQKKNSELHGGLNQFGLSRQEIHQKHYDIYGRFLPDWQLRQQIIPMLETSGLITQEPDPLDKRKILIYPTTQLTISQSREGVKDKEDNNKQQLPLSVANQKGEKR